MSVSVGRTWRWRSAGTGEHPTQRAPELRSRPRLRRRGAQLATAIAAIAFSTGLGVALVLPAGAIARQEITPAFVSIHARALTLTWRGESVLVRARVENSTRCRLIVLRNGSVKVHFSRHWRSCTNGRFTERVRFGPNAAKSAHVAELRLLARNHFGAVVARNLTIHLRAHTVRHSTARQSAPTQSTDTSSVQITSAPQQSTGWAGYVSTLNSPATSASATWTVPSITCGAQTTWLGTWVGVDGAESSGPGTNLVFQDGVYSYCISGQQENQAWWESYPGPANGLGSVSAGDTITASVREANGGWNWSVTDQTTGASWSSTQPVNYSGPAGTAEWIVEDPGAPTEPFVSGFTPVTFTNMTMTTANGSTFTDGSTWQMVQSGQALATPSQSAASIAANHSMTVRYGG